MADRGKLTISRVPMGAGKRTFLVYDIEATRLVHELTDYAQELLYRRNLSELTVEQGLNHLAEFWCYLKSREILLIQVSDRIIESFRDENYKKVRVAGAHRGSVNDAKKTVNLKLYRIYDWLVWLQTTRRLPVGTVGLYGLVTAVIEHAESSRKFRGARWLGGQRKYPLLFRVPDLNAKHDVPAHVIADSHMTALASILMRCRHPYLAQRNQLFVNIADAAGFRRGSICSLETRQFNLASIHAAEGEFLVRPARQKFGYEKTFGISLTLAYQIRHFIDEYWYPWVVSRGLSAAEHENRLFLSFKTGRPITERAMSQVVSGAFRGLGFEKGIGPHALRSKFTAEETDHELAERLKLGLDTSSRSIAAAIAPKLGHNDPEQFYGYASSSQARIARIAREGRLAELESLRRENQTLREERDASRLSAELISSKPVR